MQEKKESYVFADFIRFVAMGAIIFQHSFIVDKVLLANDQAALYLYFALKVIAKIGSISFFTVSGYLLSAALDRYSPKEYLKKRLNNIIKPYVLFVLLYLILDSAGAFYGQQRISNLVELPSFIGSKVMTILFYTSYWFIFNYFISVLILLSLYKYLYSTWLGFALLFCTLIYSVNIHAEWFPAHHTTAFAGFTFFLWLGAYLKKHEGLFWDFVKGTSYWKWAVILFIALALNLYETFYLLTKGAQVVDSSLKFTNIIYALTAFGLLCKISSSIRFTWFNPRIETYPLYLVHPLFLKVLNYALLPLVPSLAGFVMIRNADQVSSLTILVYQILWFVLIYAISLFTVKFVMKTKWAWVFGK